jgi:hypothetical protein
LERAVDTPAPDPQLLGDVRDALAFSEQPHSVVAFARAVDLRPLYFPSAFALAMPSRCRSSKISMSRPVALRVSIGVAAWHGSRKTTATAPSGPGAAKRRTPRSACNTADDANLRHRERRRRDARGAWFSLSIVSGNAAGCYRGPRPF